MQAIIIGVILAVLAGFLAKSISNAWMRFCVISAFALFPILLAVIVLSFEECEERMPNGLCNGAGLIIMGIVAIMPFWLLGLATGWWLKHRQTRI